MVMTTETEKHPNLYHEDEFEYKGHKFKVEFPQDNNYEAPWERSDYHGPVRRVFRREQKRPGERVLAGEYRDGYHLYDFAEAINLAKTKWGVVATDGKTQGQVAAEAVEQDFEYLRRWCNDQWQYVGVVVTLLDVPDYSDSLWGIESDQNEYLTETAYELADQILAQLEKDHATAAKTRKNQLDELMEITRHWGLVNTTDAETRERLDNFLTNHFGPAKP